MGINLMGNACAPGSCGELVQGTIKGQALLISCPVDIYSRIRVELDEALPPQSNLPKVDSALKLYLDKIGYSQMGWKITRDSNLPLGKGMASSTADIVSALGAAANALDIPPAEDDIADIAIQVEPSDSIMYSGLCAFNYISGRVRRRVGNAPKLDILLIDPGGHVDTIAFNKRPDIFILNKLKESQVNQAMDLVCRGIVDGDIEMIGRGATISALANQQLLPKPDLPEVIKWSKELRGVGVVIAHSGTVMGLLLPPGGNVSAQEAAAYLRNKKPQWSVMITKMVDGGLRRRG